MMIAQVLPEHLGDYWPIFDAPIRHIESRSDGLWTLPGIVRRVLAGEWQLWLAADDLDAKAIAATRLHIVDSGAKWCEILFCTGTDREQWQAGIKTIEEWARAEGCTRLQSCARLGWARVLPGYRVTHAFIEKDLA
jgi:hypothetical protein